MEKETKNICGNLHRHFFAMVSATAALSMFITRNTGLLLVLCAIEGAALLAAAWDMLQPPLKHDLVTRASAAMITMPILLAGYHTMQNRWQESDKMERLADLVHKDQETTLKLLALLLGITGFYAVYTLIGWLEAAMLEILQNQDLADAKHHVDNVWCVVSAAFFFSMKYFAGRKYLFAWMSAVLLIGVAAWRGSSFWKKAKEQPVALRLCSLAAALGVCIGAEPAFEIGLPSPIVAAAFRAAAVYFPYLCMVWLFSCLRKQFEAVPKRKIASPEKIIYAAVFLIAAVLVLYAFTRSQAFYGTDYAYDIVYTSDSPDLVKGNAYIDLTHYQNDLRQPLFALFAMPVMGIPNLLIHLFGLKQTAAAILMDWVQIPLLMAANFLLAEIMELSEKRRIAFVILTSATYAWLLFVLMMEQYIVGYFWLMMALYFVLKEKKKAALPLFGAGGTMLTSAVLFLFSSNQDPIRHFRKWFEEMLHLGMKFLVCIFTFGRFDVLYDLGKNVSDLMAFSGQTVSWHQKIEQYAMFARNYFMAPFAQIVPNSEGQMSFQMQQPTSVCMAGCVILAAAWISSVINRKQPFARIAAAWLAFSMLMLVGLGWGTMENGLILYSLYFGWPLLVLLFQLIVWIEEKLHFEWLVPAASAAAAVVLLAVNIPGMQQLLNFAATYYPA